MFPDINMLSDDCSVCRRALRTDTEQTHIRKVFRVCVFNITFADVLSFRGERGLNEC